MHKVHKVNTIQIKKSGQLNKITMFITPKHKRRTTYCTALKPMQDPCILQGAYVAKHVRSKWGRNV